MRGWVWSIVFWLACARLASAACDPTVLDGATGSRIGFPFYNYQECRWDQRHNTWGNYVESDACFSDVDCLLRARSLAFASLGTPTPTNGAIRYCNDCTATNPCAGAGLGAIARRENGAWNCGSGAGGSGTITNVWSVCSTGNCNALTAASGDSLSAIAADASSPCKTGTLASIPGSCNEGQCYQATDAASPSAELYWCTAPNQWTAVGAAGGTSDHNALTNLAVGDVHTQYLLLAGRTSTTNNPILSTNSAGALTGSSSTSVSNHGLALYSNSNANKLDLSLVQVYGAALVMRNNSGTTGTQLRFYTPDNVHTTSFVAANQTTDPVYTLPTAAPASNGYMLSSTTGGTLSWVTPGGFDGSPYLLLAGRTGTTNDFTISSNGTGSFNGSGVTGGWLSLASNAVADGTGAITIGAPTTFLVNPGGTTTAPRFCFNEPPSSGNNVSCLQAPAQAADAFYKFPTALPASNGYMLSSLTDGTMSWTAPGSFDGTPYLLLAGRAGGANNPTIASAGNGQITGTATAGGWFISVASSGGGDGVFQEEGGPHYWTNNGGTIAPVLCMYERAPHGNASNCFQSVDATNGSVNYYWPPRGPTASGQALTATTSGVMTWADVGSPSGCSNFNSGTLSCLGLQVRGNANFVNVVASDGYPRGQIETDRGMIRSGGTGLPAEMKRSSYVREGDYYQLVPQTGYFWKVKTGTSGVTGATVPIIIPTVWRPKFAYTTSQRTIPFYLGLQCAGTCDYEAGGTCVSGAWPPTWPQTITNTVADGTCTWTAKAHGLGADITDGAVTWDGASCPPVGLSPGACGGAALPPSMRVQIGTDMTMGDKIRVNVGDNEPSGIVTRTAYESDQEYNYMAYGGLQYPAHKGTYGVALNVGAYDRFGDSSMDISSTLLTSYGPAIAFRDVVQQNPPFQPPVVVMADTNVPDIAAFSNRRPVAGVISAAYVHNIPSTFYAAFRMPRSGGQSVNGPETVVTCSAPTNGECRATFTYPYGICTKDAVTKCATTASCGTGTCTFNGSTEPIILDILQGAANYRSRITSLTGPEDSTTLDYPLLENATHTTLEHTGSILQRITNSEVGWNLDWTAIRASGDSAGCTGAGTPYSCCTAGTNQGTCLHVNSYVTPSSATYPGMRNHVYMLTGTDCGAGCTDCDEIKQSLGTNGLSATEPAWRKDWLPFCDANNKQFTHVGFKGVLSMLGGTANKTQQVFTTPAADDSGPVFRSGTYNGRPVMYPNIDSETRPTCTCTPPPVGVLGQTWTDATTSHTEQCLQTSSTVCNWVTSPIKAQATAVTQGANISATNLIASTPTAQQYRMSCYVTVTRQATTSSTIPNCNLICTDPTDSVAKTIQVTPIISGTLFTLTEGAPNLVTYTFPGLDAQGGTANATTGTATSGVAICDAKAATAVQYSTANWASSGATSMQYKIYVKLETL